MTRIMFSIRPRERNRLPISSTAAVSSSSITSCSVRNGKPDVPAARSSPITFDGTLPHLNHHDVTLVAVARAPMEKIEAYKKRMGWKFPWVSSFSNDFNFDYHVSFTEEQLAGEKVF